MISRSFALLLRAGVLPTPPDELQGLDIDIEYVSPLAKAQKMTDLQSMLRGFETMLQMSQVAPVMDYLDEDGLVNYIVETTGMPARIIKSRNQVQRERQQKAEAAAAVIEQNPENGAQMLEQVQGQLGGMAAE